MTSRVLAVGPYSTAEDLQYEESSDRAMMRALPEEERAKINQQVRAAWSASRCVRGGQPAGACGAVN